MSRGLKLAELGRIQYERNQEQRFTPTWAIVNEPEQEDDFNNNDQLDIESDQPSEHSEHNTDSEQSENEQEENDEHLVDENRAYAGLHHFTGKDKTTHWMAHPFRPNVRTPKKNIVIHPPGVKATAKNANTERECWALFITPDMVEHIVRCTNIYITKMREKYSRERDCRDTDISEMYAFLGLLYMAGVKKAQYLNTKELWDVDGTAPDCFRLTMSRERFHILIRALRFDDINDRNERKKIDNLAHIRQVFDQFVSKCKENYQVGEYCTIDEMLEGFRGRCKFRQYIANKPAKYGLKIYALVDARMFYTCNLEIYSGKQPDGPFKVQNTASDVVKRIAEPILNTGRNLTMDNYFTSIPLAKDLLANRTTMVGTLRKNKREIPALFVNTKDRSIPSSVFGFRKDIVLLSYKPKPQKNVLMLSTLHSEGNIDPDSGEREKPEIITFYNLTKGGVDVVDELKSTYSVSRFCCRWPLRLFFTILDIAGINSNIIFKSNTGIVEARRNYLKSLAQELIKPQLIYRASIRSLPIDLRTRIRQNLKLPELERGRMEENPGFCGFCPRRKNRRTKKRCGKCHVAICTEHTSFSCQPCSGVNDHNDSGSE